MKERPILFSAPMILALLAGRKTQTRRICKPAEAKGLSFVVEVPDPKERGQVYNGSHFGDEDGEVQFASPHGGIRDRLWIREAYAHIYSGNAVPAERRSDDVAYKTDGFVVDQYVYGTWKPSIHMPRWASRITLEILGVRVERLQAISYEDALAEGVADNTLMIEESCQNEETVEQCARRLRWPQRSYSLLWDNINGQGSWGANPWVFVISFRRVA